MSEFRPPTPEQGQAHLRQEFLHDRLITIVMRNKRPAPKLNADIIAILVFPAQPGTQSGPKQIAIVDYGPDFPNKLLVPGAEGFKRPTSRYGFRGINYQPETQSLVYAPFPAGVQVVLGSAETVRTIHDLGLSEHQAGNEYISPYHLWLAHDNDLLDITDDSEHGTAVQYWLA
jgi:hypothetical protein